MTAMTDRMVEMGATADQAAVVAGYIEEAAADLLDRLDGVAPTVDQVLQHARKLMWSAPDRLKASPDAQRALARQVFINIHKQAAI